MIRNRLSRSGYGSALRAQFGAGGSFVPASATGQRGESEALIAAIMEMLQRGQTPAIGADGRQWSSGVAGGFGGSPYASTPPPDTMQGALAGGGRDTGTVNGFRQVTMPNGQSYLFDPTTGALHPFAPGNAAPNRTIEGGSQAGGVGGVPNIPAGGQFLGYDAQGRSIVRLSDGTVALVNPDGSIVARSEQTTPTTGTQPTGTQPVVGTDPVGTQPPGGTTTGGTGWVAPIVEGNVNPVATAPVAPVATAPVAPVATAPFSGISQLPATSTEPASVDTTAGVPDAGTVIAPTATTAPTMFDTPWGSMTQAQIEALQVPQATVPTSTADYSAGVPDAGSTSGVTDGMLADLSTVDTTAGVPDAGTVIAALVETPAPITDIPPEYEVQIPLTDEELHAAGLLA